MWAIVATADAQRLGCARGGAMTAAGAQGMPPDRATNDDSRPTNDDGRPTSGDRAPTVRDPAATSRDHAATRPPTHSLGTARMADGTTLRTLHWERAAEPWALAEIVHGLGEHGGRYE